MELGELIGRELALHPDAVRQGDGRDRGAHVGVVGTLLALRLRDQIQSEDLDVTMTAGDCLVRQAEGRVW